MLYAEYKGTEVWASEFPREIANLNTCKDGLEHYPKCPECYKRVTHRSQSSDGRSANFAHCGWSGSGGKGGGNACSGATVGESQEHKAMKDIAASAVGFALDAVGIEKTYLEVELAANYSDADWRTADCVIEFETRDEQLGEGLIIEVQYQNKAKDKEEVTLDYLNISQEYSVLWLSQQDFETDPDHPKDWSCRVIDEATVRRRVRQQLWPIGEARSIWSDRAYSEHWSESPQVGLLSSANASSEKTAKDRIETVRGFYRRKDNLPKPKIAGTAVDAIADEYRHSHKNSHGWRSLFRAEHAQQYIEEVANSGDESTQPPKPKVAGTAVDGIARQYKESVNWADLFTESLVDEFIREVQVHGGDAIRTDCPACHHTHDIDQIARGELSRGKVCRECGGWFTVFDRDRWIGAVDDRDRESWQEVVANV